MAAPTKPRASSPIPISDPLNRPMTAAQWKEKLKRWDVELHLKLGLYMSDHVDQKVQEMRNRLKRNGEMTMHGELIFAAHINRAVAQLHHKFSLTQLCNSTVGSYQINPRQAWQL